MEKKEEKWSKPRAMVDRLDRIVRWSTEGNHVCHY
ncbi:hypothetical protein T05_9200 [Trichinella murrelli]|uniref:Uncharacterized protein n=1 Tax=Trichinella murrelli TaxID=144512 RepID=A0A0V0T3G1_9BILA|nr:hypothetical protein T05_9200 [Trichinella murrelli]